jgi:hypothetical protein
MTTQTKWTREDVTSDEWVAKRGAPKIEGNSWVLLLVNCRSILNKSLNFLNLVEVYYYYLFKFQMCFCPVAVVQKENKTQHTNNTPHSNKTKHTKLHR